MTTKIKQQTRECTQSSQCPECGNEMNIIKERIYRCPKCRTQIEKKIVEQNKKSWEDSL